MAHDQAWLVALGIVQGALLPFVWWVVFRRTMRSASPALEDAKSITLLVAALLLVALSSAAVILGPLYLLGLIPLGEAGASYSYSWAGSMVAVFGICYGVRKYRAVKGSVGSNPGA